MPDYVLLQSVSDPFTARFDDPEGRLAFTVSEVERNPNLLLRITREAAWSQQHPTIMGPSTSFLYFGPNSTPGYLVYGNGPTNHMATSLRAQREGSTSRYFTAQNTKHYKWRITPTRMECMDGRSAIAVWEVTTNPNDAFYARLTLKPAGLPIITEIITSLSLNRMSAQLNWPY